MSLAHRLKKWKVHSLNSFKNGRSALGASGSMSYAIFIDIIERYFSQLTLKPLYFPDGIQGQSTFPDIKT